MSNALLRTDTSSSTSNISRHLAKTGKKSAAIVITRPPEIITCVKISIPDNLDVFMVFDSHSRRDHPNGAGFIFSTSIDVTAQYLDNLLAIDEKLLSDPSLQWQTQLLANFSGLLFVAKNIRFDNDAIEAERAMVDSSLTILALQAEVSELKSRNASLQRDLQAAETKVEEERSNSYRPSSSSRSSKKSTEPAWTPAPTKKKHRKKKGSSSSSSPTDYRPGEFNPILQLIPTLMNKISGPPAPFIYYSGEPAEWPPLPSRKPESPSGSYVTSKSSPSPSSRTPTPPVALDHDIAVLYELQQEFDDEDFRLRTEREELTRYKQLIFTCPVCTDEFPEDFVARVPDCDHGFCRECLKTYTVSKLEEHRFPILCPSCVADDTGKQPGSKPSVLCRRCRVETCPLEAITNSVIFDIGVSQDHFDIFEELQLTNVSILLHCRKLGHRRLIELTTPP